MTIGDLWSKCVYKFFKYAPSMAVSLTFLPCGLVFGYTICSLVAERNIDAGVMVYGPMILGACTGLLLTIALFLLKYFRGRITYWHIELLICAGAFHILASCFYFANSLDDVGAFMSYLAHSITYVAGLSFLHSILSKCSRAIFLSLCFSFYLLGTASAVSLIDGVYLDKNGTAAEGEIAAGLYVDFAGVYLSVSTVILAILIGLKVLSFLGNVDCENSLDNELRIANSNGSIFDKRQDVIKRIQFFYVTKNQQWNVSLLLLFTAAIEFALFVYFIFWFSMNDAMRLTEIDNIDAMFWVVFAGGVACTVCLIFVSVKVNFVSIQICLIVLTVLAMIICNSTNTRVPFWLILFFFGMSFPNLQIALVEVAHFLFVEVFIYISYGLQLLSVSLIYYYFVSNSKNSYFNATDQSTIMAQGFVFMIITALIALVVGMKVPRTHRTSLFDIQYGLLGIIFMKHQIEQLNVKWLNDGTIPTISQPDTY